MKNIFFLLLFLVGAFSFSFAQKAIPENQVPELYAKDFKAKEPNAKDAKWTQLDSATYQVSFTNATGNKVSLKFLPTTTETRWDVDLQWMPQSIKNYIDTAYTKAKVQSLCIADIYGERTYEAVVKEGKKEMICSFTTTGVFKKETLVTKPKAVKSKK